MLIGLARLLTATGFAAGIAGCASLETVAPPVSPAMLSASRGATVETLETGRRILTTRCAACHKVYAVADYTPAEWHGIVVDMAHRTKLTEQQETAVMAYLQAAHNLPPAPAATPPTH